MGATLALEARFWPRTSRLGGYRARGAEPADSEPPVREDDDSRWNWTGDDATGDASNEEPPGDR